MAESRPRPQEPFLAQVVPKGPRLGLPYFDWATMPELQGGVGGWTVVERPRLVSAVEFGGTPAFTLDLAVIFDGYRKRIPVEPQLRLLRRFGQPVAPAGEPPVLQVGNLGMDRLRWVLTDLKPGQGYFRTDWQHTQAWVTVSLTEYHGLAGKVSPADSVRNQVLGLNASGAPYKSPPTRLVLVARGDTWVKLALRYLKSGRRATELAQLNGRGAGQQPAAGSKVKVPLR